MIAFVRMKELRLVDLEKRGRGVGALERAAEADELPTLAVNHGGVADALEQMNAVDHRRQHVAGTGGVLSLRVGRVNLVKKAIEPLPLLGGDFFAHLARIFARRADAKGDRGGIDQVKDELARHRFQRAVPLDSHRPAEGRGHLLPALLRVGAAGVEHQAHGHVEQARSILSPLQIAAHPVEAVGDAR